MWPLSSKGGEALVAGPLKKIIFCGFPKGETILLSKHAVTPTHAFRLGQIWVKTEWIVRKLKVKKRK